MGDGMTQRRSGCRCSPIVPVVSFVVGAIALAACWRRWDESHAVARLLRGARASGPAPVAEAELARLPEPVARWLRASGVVGRPIPAVVHLEQEGRLRSGANAHWMSFTARQWTTTDPPGFLWLGRSPIAPGLWVGIRDAFRDGRGRSRVALWDLAPLGRAGGAGIDEASLQRWLGELAWLPAAALDSRIAWRQTGPDAAVATMTVGRATASVTFRFDAEGRVRRIEADRWRADVKAIRRWQVLLSGWTERAGVTVPAAGEVVWDDPAGAFPAIQLRLGVHEVVR